MMLLLVTESVTADVTASDTVTLYKPLCLCAALLATCATTL